MNKKKQQVNNLLREIQENNHKKVFVYSLEGCPACEDLKTKLDKIGLVYENVEMSGNNAMWDKLTEWGGSEFVPQVKVGCRPSYRPTVTQPGKIVLFNVNLNDGTIL